jgi:SNF2 family DNA or RNA helicase
MVDPALPVGQASLTGAAKPLTDRHAAIPAFKLPLTWANLVQLSRTLPGATWDGALELWAAEQVIARTTTGEPLRYSLPDGLKAYPWQSEAAGQFARLGGNMYSDDPGTGKTISALLAVVERELRHGDALPALVVSPGSVCTPWQEAARRWLPRVPVTSYRGLRRSLNHPVGVFVTSYDILARDADKLAAVQWGTLVLDEHHMIKNRSAKRTQAATKLAHHTNHAIALSGTPLTHSPDDVFATLRVLDRDTWPDHSRFVNRYCDTAADDYGERVVGLRADREPEFYAAMAGSWRRVTKADALPFLPPKVYSRRTVAMPDKWRRAYDDFAATMSANLPDGGELDVMNVLTQLAGLMAMTAGPCRVEYEPNADPNRPDHVHVILEPGSWKVAALAEVLAERPDQQVLVFSPSRQLIDLAAAMLAENRISHAMVVGAQSHKARDAEVAAFQGGTRRVMLATTQAGGVGLTMTAASTVVFLSRPFSLVDALQAEDRAHRIGSERHESIEIVDIVTENSIDQRVAAILRERNQSLADFLKGARGATLRELI